ncbi:MAG: nuclear transport factor 2 family protein [Solirubrobacterales bacterium]|nr:nuclear transport factor 2 family protein [Solirubrobacterales bacterium]
MPSTRETTEAYFGAIARQDLDGMAAAWEPGSTAVMFGMAELRQPDDGVAWFGNLFRCFPDFSLKVEKLIVEGDSAAVHWSATGTFDGEGLFEGLKPTGATIAVDGIDIVTVADGRLTSLKASINGMDLGRQVGALPPAGSPQDRIMTGAFNAKTVAVAKLRELAGSSRSRKG